MNELNQQAGMSAPLFPSFFPPFDTPAPADHAFEPFLDLEPAKREALLASLAPRYEAIRPRERKWKDQDYSNFRNVLVLVVANALSAAQHPLNQRVHYSRTNTTYCGKSAYYPDFLRTPTLKSIVDTLGELGMLDLAGSVSGYNDVPSDATKAFRQQSTFWATDQLHGLLRELGISAAHVVKSPEAPVIHLHCKRPEKEGARKTWKRKHLEGGDTELVEFDLTDPATASMNDAIRAYNAFLAGFDLSLDLNNPELLTMHAKPRKDGSKRAPVNASQKSLFRTFSKDFEHGGRFFGGWWINMPSEYRDHILINGAPTVELDYSGCFIRMLYHLEGIDLKGDPYAIPVIMEAAEKQHLQWEEVRQGIKVLTNIYINALEGSSIGRFPDATRHLPKGLRRPNAVYPLIQEHHRPIAHWFRSGCALKLMKIEADICQSILLDGMRNGVPVLPVHDSFVVPEQYEGWLYQTMTENYRHHLGFDPKIKRKEKTGEKMEVVRAGTAASWEGVEGGGIGTGVASGPIPVPPTSYTLGENVREPSPKTEEMASDPPDHHGHIWAGILAKHRQPAPITIGGSQSL